VLADAALQLVGARFRLAGRDPATGLDCVGLLICSLRSVGCVPVAPEGYRLRNTDPARWFACAVESGLVAVEGPIQPGDVILLRPGPGQQHVVIAEGDGIFIHAHAGLGRVVRQPITLSNDIIAHWRLP
jgi:cell wall-associated NlpC family hydrolase